MPRQLKQWKPIFHFIFIIAVTYYICIKTNKFAKVKIVTKFKPDMRHILLWTNTSAINGEGQKPFLDYKCQHFNCYIITNRSFFNNLGLYDAIVFNLQDVSAGSHDLPQVRSLSQKYVLVANDSADNYPVCDSVYDTFFNWTWTYKQDSTIAYRHLTYRNSDDDDLTYSRFKWLTKMKPINPHLQSQLTSKHKAAAVFLDKCKTRSKREVYIQNLQEHLSKYNLTVDIFGECGPKKCRRKTMANCFWRLKHQYYFYLAMEDSFAKDYLTKEVLYAFNNNAVPIVYGGAAYAEVLPPYSYLNANDFNEEAMAYFMNNAIVNKTLYYNFFRWRNHYKIYEGAGLEPCSLCKGLNNAHWLTFHTDHRWFRKWWNPSYEKRCTKFFGIPFL